jgi:hypothetical protein
MSQQINLLLPELKPRFDWLALPVVAGAGLVGLLLVVVMASAAAWRLDGLKARESALRSELASLQQQLQVLGQRLAERKGDAMLDKLLDTARTGVAQRQQVLNIVAQGDLPTTQAYSGLFQGFSRQVLEGAWLTGFGFADKDIEIRGRLTDPALLPAYIGRLNAELAFAGRRFATLDMKAVDPAAERRDVAAGAAPVATPPSARPVLPRYTEFVLRTEAEKAP